MATTEQLKSQAIEKAGGDAKPSLPQKLEAQKEQLRLALGAAGDADQFARNVLTAVRTTPKLALCSPDSIIGAMMVCAQVGLEPGPLGHVYLVPRWNSRTKTDEAVWQLGYKGVIELARRGGLTEIEVREVREHDDFEIEYGLNPILRHKPARGDRGPIVSYWGLARWPDGLFFCEVGLDTIAEHRARSATPDKGPWVTDEVAMSKKSVVMVMKPFLPLRAREAMAFEHDGTVHLGARPDMVQEQPVYIDADIIEPPEITSPESPPGDGGEGPAGSPSESPPPVSVSEPPTREEGSGTEKAGHSSENVEGAPAATPVSPPDLCGAPCWDNGPSCALAPGHPGDHADAANIPLIPEVVDDPKVQTAKDDLQAQVARAAKKRAAKAGADD